MLDKATVIPHDQYYITTYKIEVVNPDGTSRIAQPVLGVVPKGEGFDEEENASRQNNRIPVTVFI